MIAHNCQHERKKRHGRDRKGNQRFRCLDCGKTWIEAVPRQLGAMRVPLETAKLALRLVTEGMSIRATERATGLHRDTVCRLVVFFGDACQALLDERMRGLKLTHLQFDEQHTYVAKKAARIPVDARRERYDIGEMFIWTCIDQKTKLIPAFLIGKRTGDNARRFMMDVAGRLDMPKPHASDAHAFATGGYQPVVPNLDRRLCRVPRGG